MSRSPLTKAMVEEGLCTSKTKRQFDDWIDVLRRPGAFGVEERAELEALAEVQVRRFASGPDEKIVAGRLRGAFRNVVTSSR